MRSGKKGSEKRVRGWGLIDEWDIPAGGRGSGWVRLSTVVAELLQAESFVLVDAKILETLVRRSALAARLWVLLEGETLTEVDRNGSGWSYGLFSSRPGEPARDRQRAAIAELCRLEDPRRRRSVDKLRRACEIIEAEDTRYRLLIKPSKMGREGMWNLFARRWKQPSRSGSSHRDQEAAIHGAA